MERDTAVSDTTGASHKKMIRSDDDYSSGEERSIKRNLFNAVEGNNFEEVKKILDNFKGNLKSLVNAQDANNDNNTPLHVAIIRRAKKKFDNFKIIELLIEKDADVNAENGNGKTLLDLVQKQLDEEPNDSNWLKIRNLLIPSPSDNIENVSAFEEQRIDPTLDHSYAKKTTKDQNQVNNPTRETRPKIRDSIHGSTSSIKRTLHGIIYQSKLLMLFVKRAVYKKCDFRLATEMGAAEKFDDVVFKYQDQGKWTYRFLQAKHKQNPQRDKISVNELKKNKDDNFSLQKYFVSFCKIKENSLFQGGDLKDFIIATNTDFDFEINRKYKKDGQERKDSKERNDLIEQWKNFFEFKNLSNTDKILYFGKGEKTGQFKKDAQTKAAIEKEIKSALEKNIQEIEKNLKVKYNKTLDDELKSLKDIVNNNFTNNIGDFLERLTFITNYPSEKELGGIIKLELGEEFDLLNADLVSNSFEREMLDFLKSYDKGGKAEFYSSKNGEDFFKAIKEKINTLMASGLSKSYPEKLRGYGIRFEKNLERLNDFLSSKNKQIFHLATQATRLSTIKVLQTLESDKFKGKYNHLGKEDGYIFMRLRTLLRQDTQEYIINSFDKQGIHDLLVIECQDKTQGKTGDIEKLYAQLSRALNSNSSKKIILTALSENTLAGKFRGPYQDKYQKEDDQNSFKNLSEYSQARILEREVNFQGKDIGLNQLIDKNSANDIIDQTILSKLLEEEKLAVGDTKAFSSIGYVPNYYIDRTFYREQVRTSILKEASRNAMFFITVASGPADEINKKLISSGIKEKEISSFQDYFGNTDLYDRDNYNDSPVKIILSSLTNSEESNEKKFQKLYQFLNKNVHWLMWFDNQLFYEKSSLESLSLNHFDKGPIITEKEIIEPVKQKIIIIANDPGVGKSTVLTYLANSMKEKDPTLWVVRVNLNDYAVNEKEPHSLHNIKFKESETKKAIEFVSEMAVPADPNTTNIQLGIKLFEAGLKDDKKPKIVILFDGFDEISPSYKPNTTKLIKALKGSKVTQLWVTTRVHEKVYLEDQLESPAYILKYFNEDDEKFFLNRFWKNSLMFSKEQDSQETYKKIREYLQKIKSSVESLPEASDNPSIQSLLDGISNILDCQATEQLKSLQKAVDELNFSGYAEALLERWNKSINDSNKEFTPVPLNLRMLAEVIFENKFQPPRKVGLLDLYEEFIKVKFNIYSQEKAKTIRANEAINEILQRDLESLLLDHQELALSLFFPESNQKEFKQDEKIQLVRVGLLILKENQLEFIHRSFAEYFLSEYLIKNLKNKKSPNLHLEEILLKKDYALVRQFFNGQLKKEPLSLFRAETLITKGSEILLVVAIENHTAIVRSLLDTFKESPDIFKRILLESSNYSYNVLGVAIENDNIELIQLLLDSMKGDYNTFEELALKAYRKKTALHHVARTGHNEIIGMLLAQTKENLQEKRSNLSFSLPEREEGENGNEYLGRVRELFLKWGKDNLKPDYRSFFVASPIRQIDNKGQTNLYVSTKKHKEITRLRDWYSDWNEKNPNSKLSPMELIESFQEHIKETIPSLLGGLLLSTDNNGATALHWAAENGHTETVEVLLNWVKSNLPSLLGELLLSTDNDGATALYWAAENGHTETVEVLLDSVKEDKQTLRELVLATDQNNQTALDLAIGNNDNQVTNLLKKSYDTIASSLLNDDTNIADFSNEQLHLLEQYVKSNGYIKENKQEILDKINQELNKRPEQSSILSLGSTDAESNQSQESGSSLGPRPNDGNLLEEDLLVSSSDIEASSSNRSSSNGTSEDSESNSSSPGERSGGGSGDSEVIPFTKPGLLGGNSSDAGEAPEVLRLRGGSSLAERYIEGYNLAKSLSEEMRRLLEQGAIQKGELPVLLYTKQVGQKQWKIPLLNKESLELEKTPEYLNTDKEIFSQMKGYLQEQAEIIRPYYRKDSGALSFREELPEEAVDGLNSSFLVQAVFNWFRHGFGPELQKGMGEDLSKILRAQFYVQVSMMTHGVLSDTKSVVDNVKLLMREEAMAVETFNSFEHSMLSSANSALGLGLGGAMVVLDALELSKLTDPSARAVVTTQLVFDSLNLGVGAGALLSGIIASKAAAGSALAEVAATSSAALGYLAVPLAGIGIGVTALVQVSQQAIEQAKGVGRMLNALKKELGEGYVYEKQMRAFISPGLAGINKLTLTSEGIGLEFAPLHYNRFRSGWHNVEPIREGAEAYGSFLKTLGLPDTLEIQKCIDQEGGTLVMPYIPSRDYDFSLGGAPCSYFRYDAEFATAQEMQRKDAGFHFQVLFYTPIPFDHIIRSYRIHYKATDVEIVVKKGNWNLIFPWVYDKGSKDGQERKDYIKNNAKHIAYKIRAEGATQEIILGLPPSEFPLNLSLSGGENADVQWIFEVSHLDKNLSVRLEGGNLQIGSFKIRLSGGISKEQLVFRRQVEERLQSCRLTSKGLEWKDVEIITGNEDLGKLKEKLHTQISLHKGHEDYLRVDKSAKDQVTYYDVGKNRYINTPLSFEVGGKEYYAREALLLNVEGSYAYFYSPWQAYTLSTQGQEKLPLLFWGVEIDGGKTLLPERISFSSREALSKCIEISPGEGFELITKIYHGLGTTFLEERYESKVSKKVLKLLWQLTKGQNPRDLDLYLHAIEGVSKLDCIKSFKRLYNQVMLKNEKGQVQWWLKKEKQFVEALPASAQGAYPVPLRIAKNTQGEGVCFWPLHQKDNLFDLIYQVGREEKKRFKDIKFISEVGDHLILESQEGIIYHVDVDFKCTIIGLEQDILREKKPSDLQVYLKEKKDYAAVLSLKGYQDALSKPLMSWYDVRADRYYVSHYEGLYNFSYKGTTKEGSGLIYDPDQKTLYILEGIKARDLDRHYSPTPQGAAAIGIVSKREKLASGVKSALSDGHYLQIEDSESCLWRCDIKKSFSKWYLISLQQNALKDRISSESLLEKIQKAKDNFSKGGALNLEVPEFISLGQLGFYCRSIKKLLLINLHGKKAQEIEVLGIDDGGYGYVNVENIIYQIALKDVWARKYRWPQTKTLGEGKIKRIEACLVLLEVSLSKEALTLLRGIKDIKAFYLNAAQVQKQDISQFHVNVPLIDKQERAPVVIALGKENVPYGEIQIHFDYNASAHYKIFKEQEDLIIGHGSGKKELIIKKAFSYAQRAKIEFHIQKGSSEKEVLPLEKIEKCIKSLASSSGESESKTIKIEDLIDLIQLSSNEIIKDSGED